MPAHANPLRDELYPPLAPAGFDAASRWDEMPNRGRKNEESETVTAAQEWRAVTASPYTWEVCADLPYNDITQPTGGRYRDYPDWLMFFVVVAMPMFGGSTRAATAAISDPAEWQRFIRHVHPYVPTGWTSPLTGLPKAASEAQDRLDRLAGTPLPPPKRHHVKHFKRCWTGKTGQPRWFGVRARMLSRLRRTALQQALDQDRFPADRKFAPTHPTRTVCADFDGTVFSFRRAPGSTDADPGMDTELGMWVTGTGKMVYGSKFLFASTRTHEYKSRIIFDIRHVRHHVDDPGESKQILNVLRDALPHAPGIRVVTSDSALRGNDVSDVHALGPIVVNHPHVLQRGDVEKDIPTILKSHLVTVVKGDQCEHRVVYKHGAAHEHTLDGDGENVLSPLAIHEYKRVRNGDGTYRHYHVLRVPCPDGDHLRRIALFHTDGPSSDLHFNKGEYIRVIPPGSPEHNAFYGVRNDTEALHNELKARRIRLPRDSVAGQELRLIGYIIGQNAVAYAWWRKQHEQPNALDNTA